MRQLLVLRKYKIMLILFVFGIFSCFNIVNCAEIRKVKYNETQLRNHLHKSIQEIESLLGDVQKEIRNDRKALKMMAFDHSTATNHDFMDYNVNDSWWGDFPPKETTLATYSTLIPRPSFLTTVTIAPSGPFDTTVTEEDTDTTDSPPSISTPSFPMTEYPTPPSTPEYLPSYDPEYQPPRLTPEPDSPEYTLISDFPFTFTFVPKEVPHPEETLPPPVWPPTSTHGPSTSTDDSPESSNYDRPSTHDRPPTTEDWPATSTDDRPPTTDDWPATSTDDRPETSNYDRPTTSTYDRPSTFPPHLSRPSLPFTTPDTLPDPVYTSPVPDETSNPTYETGFPSLQDHISLQSFRNYTGPIIYYTLYPGVTPVPGSSTLYPPPPIQTYIPDFVTATYMAPPSSLANIDNTTDNGIQNPSRRASKKNRLRNIARVQATTSVGDQLNMWLSRSTDYTPVENWIRELTAKSMEPTHNYARSDKKLPQPEDIPPAKNSIRKNQLNLATKFSPTFGKGISLPDAYTQPQDYGFSIATGQQEKFLGENKMGMVVLGTTPMAGDHTMTTMISGAPAYKPYEVTMSTVAGDVLHGNFKLPPPPGDLEPGPPGDDMIVPGMRPPPPDMVNPYKRYDDMMDEFDEGYMIIFLMELSRLVASKNEKDVYDVIGHMEKITVDLYDHARIAWFGQPLVEVTMSIGRFLTEAGTDAVRSYASMFHHLLRTRHSALSTDVNSIIDYADMLYEHEEGYLLFDSLMEFERHPNNTDRTGRQVCDNLIDRFMRPFLRLYHSERRQALLDSVNYALKIRFPEYNHWRRSNEKGTSRGKEKKYKRIHNQHPKKNKIHREPRKIHDRRKRHRKHRHAHKQTTLQTQRRLYEDNNDLNIGKLKQKKPILEGNRRYNFIATKKIEVQTKLTNPKYHFRTTPTNYLKIEQRKQFKRTIHKTQSVQRANVQRWRPLKPAKKLATSIYLQNNIAKDIEKTESQEEIKKTDSDNYNDDDHLSHRKSTAEHRPSLLVTRTGWKRSASSTNKYYVRRKKKMIRADFDEHNSNGVRSETIDDIEDEKGEQNRRLQRNRKAVHQY